MILLRPLKRELLFKVVFKLDVRKLHALYDVVVNVGIWKSSTLDGALYAAAGALSWIRPVYPDRSSRCNTVPDVEKSVDSESAC